MGDKDVKCTGCNVAAQVAMRGGHPESVTCPRCGTTETYADFMRSIKGQVADFASEQIGQALKKSTMGNRNVRFERGAKRIRPPTRFKIEL